MADPVAYIGAITGVFGLAVSVWTRIAQQRYWRDEPIRNRQRELRIQVLSDARLLLDDIEESLTVAESRQAVSLDTSASRALQAWSLQHSHRFVSQSIPHLILKCMAALTKWESDAFEYSRTARDLEWSLKMKEQFPEEGTAGMPANWMDGLTVDEAVGTRRDARNAAAFRLEQSSEVARTTLSTSYAVSKPWTSKTSSAGGVGHASDSPAHASHQMPGGGARESDWSTL